jgi:hypothetical protein
MHLGQDFVGQRLGDLVNVTLCRERERGSERDGDDDDDGASSQSEGVVRVEQNK